MRHYYVYLGDSKRYQVLDGDGKGGWVNTGYGANLPPPRPVTARDVPEHFLEAERYLDSEIKALGITTLDDYVSYLRTQNTPDAVRKLNVLAEWKRQKASKEQKAEYEKKQADERMRAKIKEEEAKAQQSLQDTSPSPAIM